MRKETIKIDGAPCRMCTATLRYEDSNRCVACDKARHKRYAQSDKGKAVQKAASKRYLETPAGQDASVNGRKRYEATERAKATRKKWAHTKHGKASLKLAGKRWRENKKAQRVIKKFSESIHTSNQAIKGFAEATNNLANAFRKE